MRMDQVGNQLWMQVRSKITDRVWNTAQEQICAQIKEQYEHT